MRVRAACLLVVEDVKDAVRREDNKFIVMLKSHRGDVCRERENVPGQLGLPGTRTGAGVCGANRAQR